VPDGGDIGRTCTDSFATREGKTLRHNPAILLYAAGTYDDTALTTSFGAVTNPIKVPKNLRLFMLCGSHQSKNFFLVQ
jgi:hypothetical protein